MNSTKRRFINCSNCTMLVGMLKVEQAMHAGDAGRKYMRNLCSFPTMLP